MALAAGSGRIQDRSRILNRLAYDIANKADDITTAATGDIVLMVDVSDNYEVKYADATNVAELIAGQTVSSLNITTASVGGTAISATAAELNYLDQDLASNVLTRGAGVDTAESYVGSISRAGGLIITRIVLDMSTLIGSATDLDIIGESGAASCHWGQITAAKSGTIIGGRVVCLEVPAGGTADIDFYSATESTGTQDALVTSLTETALVTSGGAWTSGAAKGMTALPAANEYIYITNGAASGGTFSAGKFLIELYGV